MRLSAIGAAAGVLLLAAGSAGAAVIPFTAHLTAAQEVPANTTTGKGEVAARLDPATKVFTYTVNYSGLTGPAVAAHFHGPAEPGANAPPVVPVPNAAEAPLKGTATLTDAQIQDLQAGKWYFNLHTKANPGGEIRGQLTSGGGAR